MKIIYTLAAWLLCCCVARAAPPALEIDSLPVVAACKAGTASGPSLLRSAASGGKGDLYQTSLTTADWGGHFSHYILPAGAAASGATGKLAWDAGAILTGSATQSPTPTPALRNIYTAIVQPDGALQMVPFTWPALSLAQQAMLDLDDHAGEQRLAYLRGDRGQEGKLFRVRSSVLGDAVHSTPVYVGPIVHRAAVYLGANDGMLHAFDALDGTELFAYVPDALIAQLPQLSNPAYQHHAYVDGPASTAAIRLQGQDKTILLSGMGGGARGVFALDVTDPTAFADGLGVLWEFTGQHDALMGNVTTIPQVVRVRVHKNVYRYFAVVAGGVNPEDGKGALFLLALDKPREQGWQLNLNYYRILTPVADATLANALSAPVLVNDAEGALRYAYAGDLQGNLWRFDFSDDAPWQKAIGQPLFVARDDQGQRQPIAQQPLLAYAQQRGYVVMFGTGRLIEKADRSAATAITQSYYGIIDSLQTPQEVITGRTQLTPRYLDGSGNLLSISGIRMEAGSKGWYVDFIQVGERSVQAGMLADGAVLFNTVLPGETMCNATRSRSYVLNALTGMPDDGSFTAKLPGNEAIVGLLLPDYAPQPLLMPLAATYGERDAQGRIAQQKTYALVQQGASGQVLATGGMQSLRRSGRLSWREVANWRELHEAAK
ncbi:pilus assembly protein PilY [Duganella sp. FT80W]|uniref:Pilus assembly protein PilY n=1 Tax=Duganella guangzhouensis TaxID=2666084 RepID=A0A6I2L9G1_9BURK|nr:PilC/PilY family type IV pilus protein [Duganella guangzhouensis]MRW94342.1 pilus assembly protein PilY [Duganella guangzhouensis]